jgi:hypothetical protein
MGKLSPRRSVPGEISQLSLVTQNIYDYIIHLSRKDLSRQPRAWLVLFIQKQVFVEGYSALEVTVDIMIRCLCLQCPLALSGKSAIS